MARFVVKHGYQKDIFCDEIGMCQNILTILDSSVNRIWEDICNHLNERGDLHFGILSLILKLEMTICPICDC